jgi:hypothetical protein
MPLTLQEAPLKQIVELSLPLRSQSDHAQTSEDYASFWHSFIGITHMYILQTVRMYSCPWVTSICRERSMVWVFFFFFWFCFW